jgi:Holliday junction resolvase
MGIKSRRKAKVGEREVAALLRSHGVPARRGQQFAGGPDSPDVIGLNGVHVEVKRCEALRLWDVLEQARREAKGGCVATVWHRCNGRPWVVILPANRALAAAAASAPPAVGKAR